MIPSVQVFQNLSTVSARGPHALAGSRRAAVQVFELLLFEGVCSSVPHLSFRGEGRGCSSGLCDRHAHLLWR